MYFVYILQSSKDERTYIGFTTRKVRERLQEHNQGKVRATKHRRPLYLLFQERVNSLWEAKKREHYWKSGAGRRKLKEYFDKGFPPIHFYE